MIVQISYLSLVESATPLRLTYLNLICFQHSLLHWIQSITKHHVVGDSFRYDNGPNGLGRCGQRPSECGRPEPIAAAVQLARLYGVCDDADQLHLHWDILRLQGSPEAQESQNGPAGLGSTGLSGRWTKDVRVSRVSFAGGKVRI